MDREAGGELWWQVREVKKAWAAVVRVGIQAESSSTTKCLCGQIRLSPKAVGAHHGVEEWQPGQERKKIVSESGTQAVQAR